MWNWRNGEMKIWRRGNDKNREDVGMFRKGKISKDMVEKRYGERVIT